MANRRMIHRNVSVCEQLADCSLLARLLYTWGLPHTSDWGVLAASPRRLKAVILPISDETPDEVGCAAEELVQQGLWRRFEHEGQPYVYYPTFDTYQDIRKRTGNPRDGLPLPPTCGEFPEVPGSTRSNGSKAPDLGLCGSETPQGEVFPEVPGSDGKRPPKGREENLREEKRTEENGERAGARTAPPAHDPRDEQHLHTCNDALTGYMVAHFCGGNPPAKSPQKAQEYALACKQQVSVKGADIAEADLLAALEAGNGSQPGAETSDRFGAEKWVQRLRTERSRASPRGSSRPVPANEHQSGVVKL